MTRAVIITSYLEYPLDIPALIGPEDYLVCLDGGYDIALAHGLTPDLLIGDFDSMESDLPGDAPFQVRTFPPEKDYTDLELAFRILDPARFPRLLVIGGLGGRLDQTAVNLQMLARYTAPPEGAKATAAGGQAASGGSAGGQAASGGSAGGQDAPAFAGIDILDGRNHAFVIHGDGTGPDEDPVLHLIPAEEDSYLSLLPLTEKCRGVSLQGTRYPLEEAVLERGASLGISNEFQAGQAALSLREGSLLVMISGA
ncbi:MAG: thiamine diphosphokinase [Firmicutes bacterium]|nr:thiamine diphosphokinase [Bacillota bacterium]